MHISSLGWKKPELPDELLFKPIFLKFKTKNIDKNFQGTTPPTVFIGSKLTYPQMNVGILSPLSKEENPSNYDNPSLWYQSKIPVNKIVEYRTSLMNSRFKTTAYDVRKSNKLIELSQEVAMSLKPANIEFKLKKKPSFKVQFNETALPFGPTASLESARPSENIKIPTKIDKITSDTDLKATNAIQTLTEKGYNEHQVSQILSVGVLGLKQNRKLVPTRFSITATDDTLSKQQLVKIRYNEPIHNYRLYYGEYLGNHFFILMFPNVWAYELFEMYMPDNVITNEKLPYTTDYELFKGRKNYAENCVGGYYASRLAVTEHLYNRELQSSTLALRFITSAYTAHLGVFVVRQATRAALENKPLEFNNKKDMLSFIRSFVLKKFKYNITKTLPDSKVLNYIGTQTSLREFI